MKNHLIRIWLPIAIGGTIILAGVYLIAQQSIRQAANDPQVQMAEDGAVALAGGLSPYSLVGSTHVDMEHSLSPFVTVYDQSGKVIVSNGYLNGQVPVMPIGVFEYAQTHRDDRITWQPASTTRIAAVAKRFAGTNPGYIVVGRSLREAEARENPLILIVGAMWIAMLLVTLVVCLYGYVKKSPLDDSIS